jgi:hypothetical protein
VGRECKSDAATSRQILKVIIHFILLSNDIGPHRVDRTPMRLLNLELLDPNVLAMRRFSQQPINTTIRVDRPDVFVIATLDRLTFANIKSFSVLFCVALIL